jgi:hypothetical protein
VTAADPRLVVAYDPGVHKHARATTRHGRLLSVGFEDAADGTRVAPGAASLVEAVIIEKPRINGATRGKDPNDQMDLSIEAGDLRGCWRSAGVQVLMPTPAEWKGQIKKPHHHLTVWGELSPAERELFATQAAPHIKWTKREQAAGSLVDFIGRKIRRGCELLAIHGEVREYDWAAHNLLDAVGLNLRYLGRIRGGSPLFRRLDKV